MMETKLRIMIVDDEPDVAEVLSKGLKSQGYSVTTFTQPTEALEACKQEKNEFDVVISDIRMPQMNGFELARKLWEVNDKVQICFLSAFEIHSNEARRMFPTLKSYCFISKPITSTMLSEHIQTHFAEAKIDSLTAR